MIVKEVHSKNQKPLDNDMTQDNSINVCCFWPVNDVKGMKIADGARYLGRIESGSGLWETPLSLQVEEELQKEKEGLMDSYV